MPEKVIMYPQDEVTTHTWNILDELKSWQEEPLKDWIRENYPDPSEIYG